MENNEENLGSQEPTTTTESSNTSPVKGTNTKLIGIIAIAVVVILAVIFMFFTRSAKSTVKDYVKAMQNCNAKKVYALMDVEGAAAFSMSSSDLSKFEENYKKVMDQLKDMDKEDKKDYEEMKKDQIDDLQDSLDLLKDTKIKYSVKNIKTEKVDDCKKLTKVTFDMTVKYEDQEQTVEDLSFYTMKKGLKNYIVSADSLS